MQQAGGAHQEGASAAQKEIDDAFFAWLQDARAGHTGRDSGGAHALERWLEAVEIEVVEGDAGGSNAQGCFELFRGADQEVQSGRGTRCEGLRYNADRPGCARLDRVTLGPQVNNLPHTALR